MKVIVFDLGGTLMQYVEMPYSWVDFYYDGFEAINGKYGFKISEAAIEKSVEILKEFNPRISHREIEYPARFIFEKALAHWQIDIPIESCIETFWSGLKLTAEIFSDTIPVLNILKEKGYIIATLTDLPNGMPDEVFQRDIRQITEYFDCYVSSAVAGYRKPDCKGLQMIADKYSVPINELVFVGDEEKDRQTAVRAGCEFVHIDRTKKSEGSIGNLYGLLEVL